MRTPRFGCKNTSDKIGVLLAQLGTPDAPTKSALRPYLKQFLGDPRVIEKNRLQWWFVLNGIILNTRPKRSARLYNRIWTKDGSPLLVYTKRQTELLGEALKQIDPSIETTFGMRYGSSSLESAIDDLIDRGCSKILLFNLYPHYSATTTASNYDVVFKHLLKRRVVPTLRVAEPYFHNPHFVKALADTINESYRKLTPRPERLVLSYHGIPEEYVKKGDPYCCMCSETTRALLPLLEVESNQVIHTYQSRFGRDPWLEPYTDETIEKLARDGVKNIAVACPGFVSDCLETLDELGNEGRELFHEHGGETLSLIPCLNDHPAWITALQELVKDELGSWLKSSERSSGEQSTLVCPRQSDGQLVSVGERNLRLAANSRG